ncbi:MAG: MFS transporter [Acidimicrobiales bacterium]
MTDAIAPTRPKGPVTGVDARHKDRPHAGWWPLVVIASAHLMAILDTTVVFVALPSAQRSLGISLGGRVWVVTAYTLAFSALLLLGGRLADRLGARRTLMTGVIGFACASAIGGASIDGAMLISCRLVQGAFAALLVSSTKSMLVTVYSDPRERSKAIGIFTATLTTGLAVGLVLGGVLTTALGWRWCLYVNVPLSMVTIFGAPRVLPSIPGRPEVRIDVVGALLAALAMGTLVYGLATAASDGWISGAVITSLCCAVVLGALFVRRQAIREHPLLPLRILRDRNRGGAQIAMIFNSLSTLGMLLILTYELQSVMRYSALATGLSLVPFAACAGLGSAVIAPRLTARFAPKWMITSGILLSAAGLVPLIAINPSSHYVPLILIAEIIEGIGTGIGGPPTLATTLRGVLPGDTGSASAASSAAGQLGSSIGAALLNTIAATATAAYIAAHSHSLANTAAPIVHGYNVAMACGAILLVLAAIPVFFMINAPGPRNTPVR